MTASTVRGARRADRDIAVVAAGRAWLTSLGIVAAIGAVSACAPLPPTDPTVALREAADGDADVDGDANDAAPAPAKTPAQVKWIASEAEGAEQSKSERRPMLVHFAAEWCAACKRMAKETFGDPRFQSQAGRFVAVRIDATNDDDPQVDAAFAKYAVLGVPTLIVIDSKGHEQRRFTDFIRAEQLLGEIEQVH